MTSQTGSVGRLLTVVLPAFIVVLFAGLVSDVDLNSGFADGVVRVSDTATFGQMTLLGAAAVLMLASRPGQSSSRRRREATVVVLAMLVVVVGSALLNEHVVKPLIGVPRPNIVMLAEEGVLGPGIDDGDAFYATGSKSERRALLADRLTPSLTPDLSATVRAHWIHEAGFSLPSGHTTAAMTFATLWAGLGVLWLRGWRKRITTLVIPVWAVAVAYSRVLLGVHTAADVIVGTLVGIGLGVSALLAVRRVLDGPPLVAAAERAARSA